MVCRLLAGGRWIRTSSTRARSIWLSALLGGLCFAIGCGSGRGASGTARYQRRGWAILASRPRGGPPHGSIDQGNVFRVEHRVAGAMAPDRRDRPPFGLLHAGDLAPVVFDGEIEIGLTRHHGRVGGDCTQCFIEVAAAKLVGADVGVLPGPQHRQQVVGVAAAEIGLPAVDQEVLQRGEADLAPDSPRDRTPGSAPSRHRRGPSPGSRASAGWRTRRPAKPDGRSAPP